MKAAGLKAELLICRGKVECRIVLSPWVLGIAISFSVCVYIPLKLGDPWLIPYLNSVRMEDDVLGLHDAEVLLVNGEQDTAGPTPHHPLLGISSGRFLKFNISFLSKLVLQRLCDPVIKDTHPTAVLGEGEGDLVAALPGLPLVIGDLPELEVVVPGHGHVGQDHALEVARQQLLAWSLTIEAGVIPARR